MGIKLFFTRLEEQILSKRIWWRMRWIKLILILDYSTSSDYWNELIKIIY